MAKYELLLAFDVDDPEFIRGFEVGRIWSCVRDTDNKGPFAVHATNAEMMIRIGEALDLVAKSKPVDDTWIEVTFESEENYE